MIGVLAFLISLACGASAGMAATIAIIIVLALGFGCIVFTTDLNWFD